MSILSDNSSSIGQAIALSRQLALPRPRTRESTQQVSPSEGPAYVRFSPNKTTKVPLPPNPQPATGTRKPFEHLDPPPDEVSTWDQVIDWAAKALGAHTAFVMDVQGFVIAHLGRGTYEDSEALGTQLMVALEKFDDVDMIERRAAAMYVQFPSFWLLGMRVKITEEERFTVGVMTNQQVDENTFTEVYRYVEAQASVL